MSNTIIWSLFSMQIVFLLIGFNGSEFSIILKKIINSRADISDHSLHQMTWKISFIKKMACYIDKKKKNVWTSSLLKMHHIVFFSHIDNLPREKMKRLKNNTDKKSIKSRSNEMEKVINKSADWRKPSAVTWWGMWWLV